MKHYYQALPKETNFDNHSNSEASQRLLDNTFNSLMDFHQYVETSIKSIKNKEKIKARWHKINNDNIVFELVPQGYIYEIKKETVFEVIVPENFEKDLEESLIYWNENDKQKQRVIEENGKLLLKLNGSIHKIEKARWVGETVDLRLISKYEVPDKSIVLQETDGVIAVYLKKDLRLKEEDIFKFIDNKALKFEDGTPFEYEIEGNHTFKVLEDNGLSNFENKILSTSQGIQFKITKHKREKEEDGYWIQLEELEDNGKDEISPLSELRYFFDDDNDIQIEDGTKDGRYSVHKGREDEFKLILKKGKGKDQEFCFPQGAILKIKVNTYQLEKQKEAIETLQNMPVDEQSKLIKLFEDRNNAKWSDFSTLSDIKWEVLTDEKRDGAEEQREFVRKALSTNDFAIMEGPPGSGKTTVILELVCQIVRNGGRVLLCGSTHVAIDNVLERIKERGLIEKFNILPIRIGDEKRISDDIKEFQLNNMTESNGIQEELLLDAANLVCGTTIGILQHPKFKKRKRESNGKKIIEPVIPEFDYLIIDESSKTTFHEFLVPALYAKKWILTGDIRQLSPYTEREQIVSNLEKLELAGKKEMPKEMQKSCFYLQKLNQLGRSSKDNKFALNILRGEVRWFYNELVARMMLRLFEGKVIFFITHENLECKHNIFIRKPSEIRHLELVAADIIFIDDSANIDDDKIPEIFLRIQNEKWLLSESAFRLNYKKDRLDFCLKERNKEIKDCFEIVSETDQYFNKKSWAEEIAWRIEREYQLRLNKNQKSSENYKKQIEDLMPFYADINYNKNDISNRVNSIAAIAFPSILESLVKGIKGRKNSERRSTISEGFSKEELEKRHTVLKYQHRMHPEISDFSRENFYMEDNALLNSSSIERDWNYNRYEKRRMWIDVNGAVDKNKNEIEAQRLIEELKKFIEFAKKNPQPEGLNWSVAVITFYRGQEKDLRNKLQKLCNLPHTISNFYIRKSDKTQINIKLHTVDKFQGQEADIVFLSMVQTFRDGFMDSPNRLNVALTRAKFQLVILGDHEYFSGKSPQKDKKKSNSEYLINLANNTPVLRRSR
ncbi:MAG TPA: AAA domain-containing protein [bacterium]|nr:AAA domain-containing protein [bacterium]